MVFDNPKKEKSWEEEEEVVRVEGLAGASLYAIEVKVTVFHV